jgi:hypothetical protein
MSGRSTEGMFIFSLENRVSFASIMTHEQFFDSSGRQQISIRVKGDGRTYRHEPLPPRK